MSVGGGSSAVSLAIEDFSPFGRLGLWAPLFSRLLARGWEEEGRTFCVGFTFFTWGTQVSSKGGVALCFLKTKGLLSSSSISLSALRSLEVDKGFCFLGVGVWTHESWHLFPWEQREWEVDAIERVQPWTKVCPYSSWFSTQLEQWLHLRPLFLLQQLSPKLRPAGRPAQCWLQTSDEVQKVWNHPLGVFVGTSQHLPISFWRCSLDWSFFALV